MNAPATGLEGLLAGEHAAVYGYGTAGAVLVSLSAPGALISAVRTGYDAHRESRDSLTDTIAAAGGTAPPPLAAYALPYPLSSTAAAVRFLAGIEDRLCVAATAAVGAASTASHRPAAIQVLASAAVRAYQLRTLGGAAPSAAVTPLPGLPGR